MVTKEQIPTSVAEQAIAGPAAEQLLNHLCEEKANLEAMLAAVRDVHHALLHLDDGALQQSLENEARQLSTGLAIQSRRQQVQCELATVLHLDPTEVTLDCLVKMTSGSVRESIEKAWTPLIEMAGEVDRLNRQNAALIGQSLSIIRGVVGRLMGVSGVGESYSAKGARAGTHVGSILQWGA
jgi:hypothetical protein